MESGKLRAVARQVNAWWDQFWGIGDEAHDILDAKLRENRIATMKEMGALRLNWETGRYFEAGKRFTKFWTILIPNTYL